MRYVLIAYGEIREVTFFRSKLLKMEDNILSRRRLENLKLDSTKHSQMSEISLGEIIDQYLNGNDTRIDIDHEVNNCSECSKVVNRPGSDSSSKNSIPTKLRKFYSHNSFRQIILSVLSLMSISLCFLALFTGKTEPCESLAFISSLILLFSPSPLQLCK